VRRRGLVLALTAIAFGAGLFAFSIIPQNFFPQSSRPEILVGLWLPEGTGTAEVERQAKTFEAKVLPDPDQRLVGPLSVRVRRASSCRSTSSSGTRTSPSSSSSPRTSRRASG
jgi:multidrug efflux pump subunit AcrB